MKIAYIATNWDFGKENGITKKIASQIKIWNTLGVETKLFTLSSSETYWNGFDNILKENIYSPKTRQTFWDSIKIPDLVKAWQPDLVYWRFSIGYPALRNLALSIPTVLEINTFDMGELRASLPSSWLSFIYQLLTRDWVYRKICGAVFVTQEIADQFQKYPTSKIVISNGIDLSFQHPLITKDLNFPIRLVFISSDNAPSHGIDKIYTLARNFPEWKIDLIGKVKINDQTPDNVTLHSLLSQTEYDQILAQVDIGIATLSLYKKNMEEACPLKTREYLSYGLPCIIGYKDTDFPDGAPFILRLPNTPDNVQNYLSEIENFVKSWKGRRVSREEIMHLDYKYKENQRINFFRQVLDSISGKKGLEPF